MPLPLGPTIATKRDLLPEPVAIAESDPADTRGKALKRDPLSRHIEPVVKVRIVSDHLFDLGIGLVDVFRIAR